MNLRPVRRTGVWLLVGVSYLASAAFVLWRLIGPSDGAPIPFYSQSWTAEGVRITAPGVTGAPLATDDLVLAVNGHSVSSWLADSVSPLVAREPVSTGTSLTYTVNRAGNVINVAVTLAPQDPSGRLLENWLNLLFAAVLLVVALYVLFRRPDLSASVALAVAAAGTGASITPWFLGFSVSDIYFGWPFLLQVSTVMGVYMLLWPAGLLHLPLAMAPSDSGLPRPNRRVLSAVYGIPLVVYAVGLVLGLVLTPSLTAWIGTWGAVQSLISIPCVVIGITLGAISYRRAPRETQRQIRWVLMGGVFATLVGMVFLFLPQLLFGQTIVPWSLLGLIALPMPVALAFAIVRNRLFDIEVIVNRTLVYGGVTLTIAAIYTAAVLALGAAVPQGAGFPAQLLATGLAAIAALPVRDRLQRSVNRLMYGDRDEPYRALARLGQRLESTIEPLAIPSAIVENVAEALRLPYVALEIGPPDAVELTASHGSPVATAREISLTYGAETVGRLLLAPRAPGEAFSASDLRLLEDLARSAGAAVHSVRLTLDIVRARERTVAAREEERRRIRRDLHDGLGPSLAAIGMRVELAAELAASDPHAAQDTLTQLNTEVRGAISEIRRLVEGLRPPSLDERGLVGAIQAQADRLGPQPSFSVMAKDSLPELPAAVEVAAYRIAVEAMTNAARHAHAHDCRVVIRLTDDGRRELRLEVSDDGDGLPADARPGIGLTSMHERAVEVGGSLEIARGSAGGTTVTARLPIGAAA
jgi:signal transduction histidine kinase